MDKLIYNKTYFLTGHETEAGNIYWNIDQKCKKITKNMEYFIFLNQNIFNAPFVISIYFVIIGNFDTSTWILPLHMVVPFSTDSLFGWYLLWWIQWSMGIFYGLCTVVITAFFVCCCFYIEAICEHFDFIIQSMNADVNPKSQKKFSNENPNVIQKFIEALKVHETLSE